MAAVMNDDAMKPGQSLLEAILTNAVDAIITIDSEGVIESLNPATERMFLYSADEMIGQNVKMLMPKPYCDEHDEFIANYHKTRKPKIIGIGREVIGRRKDGQTFPMHLAVSEVLFDGNKMFTGVVRDISDLKAAEKELNSLNEQLEERVRMRTKQLEEAQAELVQKERLALLGQVSGGIAHEIRNPLNAVKTSAYFLLHAKSAPPEKVEQHLERIDRQVTIIDNVITALSDVAKLPEPKLHAVDVAAIIVQALNATKMPPSINAQTQFSPDLPPVLADQNQIQIAFLNLIRNARDAMPDGGNLTVSGDVVDGHFIRIRVTDEGIGIPPEDMQRILEPLYSTKARGMGLGLAITRTVVQKNQGELAIESKLGEGSTFAVLLPMAETEGPHAK